LEDETNEREAADEDLQNKIEAETARATDAENALQEAITAEEARAISAETALDEKLDEEIARAKTTEDEISGLTINTDIEYTLSASASTENLILESKDGIEDHFVKIKFDGNFGTINF
jgi:glutamate synthase domain-containing protein 3